MRFKAALPSAAFFVFIELLVSGCAGGDGIGGSRRALEEWGRPLGFHAEAQVGTAQLPLWALVRGNGPVLTVYIEGDGAAWPTLFQPPRDPTPDRPVAFTLASRERSSVVAYVGRPCQYQDEQMLSRCHVKYWTSHRFAPEVVASFQVALDELKARCGASRLNLVGYSGGGVLATLLAARRNDVDRLITVAAPLSVSAWTAWHEISPLHGSLDPSDDGVPLPTAIHFVGAEDRVVPETVVASFAARTGGKLVRIPHFDHDCCWARDWRRLLEEVK